MQKKKESSLKPNLTDAVQTNDVIPCSAHMVCVLCSSSEREVHTLSHICFEMALQLQC